MKPERGIVCDVHGARPKLRAQQTDAVLSQVWLGTHGTWLNNLLLGSPDVETATTSFIWMDEACYLEYVTVLLRGTEEPAGAGACAGACWECLGLLRHWRMGRLRSRCDRWQKLRLLLRVWKDGLSLCTLAGFLDLLFSMLWPILIMISDCNCGSSVL